MKLHNTHILVIDDAPQVALSVRDLLEREGANVDIATDGNEGLRKIGSHAYHMVITDIIMPGKDGFEVLEDIQKTYGANRPAIIAISGGGMDVPANLALVAAQKYVDDVLLKPFSKDDLVNRVLDVLASRKRVSHG